MYKKKVFISFDFENDRNYKYTLNMWNKNSDIDFSFNDYSSSEINSWNIPTVKSVLSRKIHDATYTAVIIGSEANKLHKDHVAIEYRNWQNFEIAKSKEYGNKLIAIQINSSYEYPEELLNSGAIRVYSFTLDSIQRALNG